MYQFSKFLESYTILVSKGKVAVTPEGPQAEVPGPPWPLPFAALTVRRAVASFAGTQSKRGPMTEPFEINRSEKNICLLVYVLQACFFLVGITAVAGLIINYVKREDARGTWLESHFRWQIRTFWFALLWLFVGAFTAFIGIGFLILWADAVWYIYRIVKGWLRLSEGKIMYPAPNAA